MRSQNLSTLLQHLQHLPAITAEKDAWPSWLISGEASFNILTLNISKFHAETRVTKNDRRKKQCKNCVNCRGHHCKSQCFAAKYLRKKHSNLINNVLHIFRVRLTKLDWLTQVILVELRSMNTPVLQAQGWREKGYSQDHINKMRSITEELGLSKP